MADLFTYAEELQRGRPSRNYRRTDPSTSKEAGEHAERWRSGDHAAILMILQKSMRPLAAEQIADELKWDSHVRANRRLPELERAGLIQKTEELHTNRSGRRAFKYRARG